MNIQDLCGEPKRMSQILKNRSTQIQGEMARRRSNELFPVHFSFSYFTIKDKKVFLAVVRDITKQSLLEEELRQGEKLQALGQLAGGIAHDFNNQVMAIMGYASLILENSGEEEVKRYANRIFRSSQRTADLTQKLLSFSRKGKAYSQDLDLHELIHDSLEILKPGMDRRYDIYLDLNAKEPYIYGDNTQLESALINLALNARDAMPDGGTISITTEDVHLPEENEEGLISGDYLRLTLSDSGVGMDKSIQKHLFEPFLQPRTWAKERAWAFPPSWEQWTATAER